VYQVDATQNPVFFVEERNPDLEKKESHDNSYGGTMATTENWISNNDI
jgi:hypothetical protein